MNMIQLIACAGLITGFFILLRVSPMDFTEGVFRRITNIANTIKGKGVSIMENNPNWHFRLPGRKELKIFKEELGISDEELV